MFFGRALAFRGVEARAKALPNTPIVATMACRAGGKAEHRSIVRRAGARMEGRAVGASMGASDAGIVYAARIRRGSAPWIVYDTDVVLYEW